MLWRHAKLKPKGAQITAARRSNYRAAHAMYTFWANLTFLRHIGHGFLSNFRLQLWQAAMWPQGTNTVSMAASMQIEHSRSEAAWPPAAGGTGAGVGTGTGVNAGNGTDVTPLGPLCGDLDRLLAPSVSAVEAVASAVATAARSDVGEDATLLSALSRRLGRRAGDAAELSAPSAPSSASMSITSGRDDDNDEDDEDDDANCVAPAALVECTSSSPSNSGGGGSLPQRSDTHDAGSGHDMPPGAPGAGAADGTALAVAAPPPESPRPPRPSLALGDGGLGR